jgi:hypothetical protein
VLAARPPSKEVDHVVSMYKVGLWALGEEDDRVCCVVVDRLSLDASWVPSYDLF